MSDDSSERDALFHVSVDLAPQQRQRLDGWIAEQEGEKPTRPEAIRRLLDLLLA